MLYRKLFRLIRAYQRVVQDQEELLADWERLSDLRAAQVADRDQQIVVLQAILVDNQRALRNVAQDAKDALDDGVDIRPGLDELIAFTNASIANLEEHLDVTSVNDL